MAAATRFERTQEAVLRDRARGIRRGVRFKGGPTYDVHRLWLRCAEERVYKIDLRRIDMVMSGTWRGDVGIGDLLAVARIYGVTRDIPSVARMQEMGHLSEAVDTRAFE